MSFERAKELFKKNMELTATVEYRDLSSCMHSLSEGLIELTDALEEDIIKLHREIEDVRSVIKDR